MRDYTLQNGVLHVLARGIVWLFEFAAADVNTKRNAILCFLFY